MRAAIYTRMSTVEQRDSPERQLGQTLPLCERAGYEVVAQYADLGRHGADDERPDFRRMLADARAGRFDVIVVDEPSRLSRTDPIAFVVGVVAPLRDANVKLHAANGGLVDWDDFGHYLMATVHQHTSNREVVNSSHRMVGKLAARAKDADYINKVPYGLDVAWVDAAGNVAHRGKAAWTRRPEGLRPVFVPGDPDRVKVVRFIFEAYATRDLSLRSVAAELNRRGVPSSRGLRWAAHTVRLVLKNRRYAGDYQFNEKSFAKWNRLGFSGGHGGPVAVGRGRPDRPVPNPESDWVVRENTHEAIVGRDLWERAQALLADNRGRRAGHEARDDTLLSQLLVCGHCGFRFTAIKERHWTRDGKAVRTYVCGGYRTRGKGVCRPYRVREDQMVDALLDVIEGQFGPDRIERLRAHALRMATAARSDEGLGELRKQLKAVTEQIRVGSRNLLKIEDDETVRSLGADLKRLRAEQAGLAAEIARLEAADPAREADLLCREVRSRYWTLRELLSGGDDRGRRLALRHFVKSVELRFETVPWGKSRRHLLRGGALTLEYGGVLTLVCGDLAPSSRTPGGTRQQGKVVVPFELA
jgi:DNA invertase Pin-like site-specific DNA recombinase